MLNPFSASPLSEHQLREVLRIVNECIRDERHNYRLMLDGERSHAARHARELMHAANDDPCSLATSKAKVEAWDRAIELLEFCWPHPELPAANPTVHGK